MDLRLLPLRRLTAAALAALAACAPAAPDPLRRYLTDDGARRAALEGAAWSPASGYARLRLARFATGRADAWERLPAFLPPAAAVRAGPATAAPRPLDVTLPAEDGPALVQALLRIGEAAFFDYPAQLVAGFEAVAASPPLAAAYGLWQGRPPGEDPSSAPRLGGLLRALLPGGEALALSCASCHAAAAPGDSGAVAPGRPNHLLDIGLLTADAAAAMGQGDVPGAAWGPGRLDVSPDGIDAPAAIPDLRVVSHQRYLHHDATLRADRDPAAPLALALRIETLLITTLGEQARPPPAVALGLGLYLGRLAPPATDGAGTGRGRALFQTHCERCHAPPDFAGEPVPLAVIGTDPALGESPERGTGSYRTPTLRAAGERRALLHDGRVPDLAALLDPRRIEPGYQGGRHGEGPVPGHRYGLELGEAERAELVDFVKSL